MTAGTSRVRPDAIPQELRCRDQWLAWARVEQPRPTKVPRRSLDPTQLASTTDPNTWSTFEQAVVALDHPEVTGIGFVLTADDPFIGIDLDHVLHEGRLNGAMLAETTLGTWIAAFNTYTEVSPSGTGLRIIGRGRFPEPDADGRKKGQIEAYWAKRFLTITGNVFEGLGDLRDMPQELLDAFHAAAFPANKAPVTRVTAAPVSLDDRELLDRAMSASNGAAFRALWAGDWEGRFPSPSEADLALCSSLAFWTAGDAIRIDALFRSSGLMRPKWDSRRGNTAYGEQTIAKAIHTTTEWYGAKPPSETKNAVSFPIEIEPAGIGNQGVSEGGVERSSTSVPPEAPLPFQQLAVVVENAPAEPAWSWRGYLALYVLALLAGRPKVGKSTLAMALVAAAVRGEAFLGLPAKAGGVLLLTEERRDTLAEKARILGLMDSGAPVYVLTRHDAGTRPWAEIVRQAMTFCREHELDVLIVDTLDRWTGLRGDAENSAGAVNEAMEPLQFAAASGLAVLALSHQRKSGGEYGEAVRGSNAFTGAVDVVIELERPSRSLQLGGHARVLRSVSRFASTPEELFFELGDDGFLPISDIAEKKSDAERAEVLDALEGHDEPVSVDTLYEGVDLGKRALRRRLAELLDKGLALRSGEGKKGDPYLWVAVADDEQSTLLDDEASA